MESSIPYISPGAVADLLPMRDAIQVLTNAFQQGLPTSPPRVSLQTEGAELLLMPASAAIGVGVKLVTVNPTNIARGRPTLHSVYVLFDPVTSNPRAFIDGDALTSVRTAAVSGVATDALAARGASRLVVFGSGPQARAHINAMRAVRPITEIWVVGSSPARAQELVRESRIPGCEVKSGVPSDVAYADIICTCTSSPEPVFLHDDLPPRVHINAVGSHHPDRRELDSATVQGAQVWVEDRVAAGREAGDLTLADIDISRLGDLSDLTRAVGQPKSRQDRTLFKGVGLAGEDLVVAAEILDRWAISR